MIVPRGDHPTTNRTRVYTIMHLDRRTYLGSSDIAGVIRAHPSDTPLKVYQRKLGKQDDISPELRKFFARRKAQEPFVASMLLEEYGIEVERLSLDDNPNRYLDGEFEWMAAEIDFEFRMNDAVREHFSDRPDFAAIPNGTLLNGEIKTVHPFAAKAWGEQGSEEVPVHYAAQVMYALAVTPDRPAALVVALFGLDQLMAFPIVRDEETIAALRREAVDFWINHVLARVQPEPSDMEEFRAVYMRHLGTRIEMTDAQSELFDRIVSGRAKMAQWKKDIEGAEYSLSMQLAGALELPLDPMGQPIAAEGDNAVLTHRDAVVGSWKKQRGAYLDQPRLRGGLAKAIAAMLEEPTDHPVALPEKLAAGMPDVLQSFQTEHWYRVFRRAKK